MQIYCFRWCQAVSLALRLQVTGSGPGVQARLAAFLLFCIVSTSHPDFWGMWNPTCILFFDKLILFEFYKLGPVCPMPHLTTWPPPSLFQLFFFFFSLHLIHHSFGKVNTCQPLFMSLHEPLYCQICAIVRSKYSLWSVEIYLVRLNTLVWIFNWLFIIHSPDSSLFLY